MADCLGDRGYKEGERIRADAVQFAADKKLAENAFLAMGNADELISNYRKQYKISRRALKISEEEQEHLKGWYWPAELDFLKEFSVAEDLEEAEALGRRYAGRLVATVSAQFAEHLDNIRCNTPRHCTSARTRGVQELLLARAQSVANARVLGRMIGFAEIQARTDRNFKRRLQSIAVGKGLMQQAASLYDSASRGLAVSGQEISARLNNIVAAAGAGHRDPGPTPEMQRMWQQRNVGMPGAPGVVGVGNPAQGMNFGGIRGAGGITGAPAQDRWFGMNETPQQFATAGSYDASHEAAGFGISGWNLESIPGGIGQGMYPFMQAERFNEGDVGNRDRIRTGQMRYPVKGGDGYVTVNMSDFPVKFADHMQPGDK